ncbi:hypothetical protein NX059_004499 [Plenodomus lindquistii]|nr:hypothetical protein NX059_004499 [Plenodomus lindquistii]
MSNTPYEQQYQKASDLFDDNLEECTRVAKHNLIYAHIEDPKLPLHYVLENSMLLVCALDNWNDAEVWRRHSESVYQKLKAATPLKDQNSQEALRQFRHNLDTLLVWKAEDMADSASVEEEQDDDELDRGPDRHRQRTDEEIEQDIRE